MILDTCALLFLANGDRRLSRSARERLSREPARWFCAISSFEIGLKYQQGKLELPLAPLRWLRELEDRYGCGIALSTGPRGAVSPIGHVRP